MAKSDHCLWVSTPKWARTSSKVTSTFQRSMYRLSRSSASISTLLVKKLEDFSFPQFEQGRHFTAMGNCLVLYIKAPPER